MSKQFNKNFQRTLDEIGKDIQIQRTLDELGKDIKKTLDSLGKEPKKKPDDKQTTKNDSSFNDYMRRDEVYKEPEDKETDRQEEQTKAGYNAKFDTDEVMARYISVGSLTIAVPLNTPIGISRRHENDEHNDDVGQGVALLRMIKEAKKNNQV